MPHNPENPLAADIVITKARLLADPAEGDIEADSWLAISGEKISGLGPMANLPSLGPDTIQIDAAGALLMPGLVNGHCHAAMSLFRGLADDLPLMIWLTEHIFPAEAAWVNPEMVYWCSKLAAAEMLLAGITLVADGYFYEDEAAQAFCDTGIRAVAGQGIIDFPAPGAPDPSRNREVAAAFLDRWQGKNALLTPAVFCHSPYTCSPETMQKSKALAREAGALWFTHLAETNWEVAQCQQRYRLSPAGLLADLELLDPQSVCIHGTWLDDHDFALLRQSGATLVVCPESNMKLAAGVVPLASLLASGVPLGLGTDGCASNNRLDLFRELTACLRLHQLGKGLANAAGQICGMASRSGAAVLGFEGRLGRLAPGWLADCIVVDCPTDHAGSPALFAAAGRGGAVSTVIVGGRLVVKQGRICSFDLAETMSQVRRLADALRQNPSALKLS